MSMDIERIKSLIQKISEQLPDAQIGELLFMHHISLETIEMLREYADEDVMKYCVALEQSIYNEIHRRVDNGELDLKDPQDFYSKLKDFYEDAEQSEYGEQIKASFLNMRKKKKGPKKSGIEKHGNEFFERYRKELGLKINKPKMKIPSPDEIIKGKSPDDIPNT